jgi:hypothetical protein
MLLRFSFLKFVDSFSTFLYFYCIPLSYPALFSNFVQLLICMPFDFLQLFIFIFFEFIQFYIHVLLISLIILIFMLFNSLGFLLLHYSLCLLQWGCWYMKVPDCLIFSYFLLFCIGIHTSEAEFIAWKF